MCVDFSRGIAEERDVKVIWKTGHLNILHARCRDTRVKVFCISTTADEIFCNTASDHLVQYFIYLISGLFCNAHGSQFFLIKLALYGDLFKSSSSQTGQGVLLIALVTRNISWLKFCSAPFANLFFFLLMRTCFPTRNLELTLRTRSFLFIFFHIASTSESVTFNGAMPMVECTVSLKASTSCGSIFIGKILVQPVPNCTLSPFNDGAFHVRISTHEAECPHVSSCLENVCLEILYLYLSATKSYVL